MYNKNQFKKINDKKLLHKVNKHWVTVSIALLGLLGGSAAVSHINVNADNVNASQDQTNNQINVNQLQNNRTSLKTNSQSNHSSQYLNNNQVHNTSQNNSNNIINQANQLHQQILNNASHSTNVSTYSNLVNKLDQSSFNAKLAHDTLKKAPQNSSLTADKVHAIQHHRNVNAVNVAARMVGSANNLNGGNRHQSVLQVRYFKAGSDVNHSLMISSVPSHMPADIVKTSEFIRGWEQDPLVPSDIRNKYGSLELDSDMKGTQHGLLFDLPFDKNNAVKNPIPNIFPAGHHTLDIFLKPAIQTGTIDIEFDDKTKHDQPVPNAEQSLQDNGGTPFHYGDTVPQGYRFLDVRNLVPTAFPSGGSDIMNVEVAPDASIVSGDIDYINRKNHQSIGTVPISGVNNQPIPNDIYSQNIKSIPNSSNYINIQADSNNSKTFVNGKTLVAYVSPISPQPITVDYILNNDHNNVVAHKEFHGNYGDMGNIVNNFAVPSGYRLVNDNDKDVQYKISNQASTIYLNIEPLVNPQNTAYESEASSAASVTNDYANNVSAYGNDLINKVNSESINVSLMADRVNFDGQNIPSVGKSAVNSMTQAIDQDMNLISGYSASLSNASTRINNDNTLIMSYAVNNHSYRNDVDQAMSNVANASVNSISNLISGASSATQDAKTTAANARNVVNDIDSINSAAQKLPNQGNLVVSSASNVANEAQNAYINARNSIISNAFKSASLSAANQFNQQDYQKMLNGIQQKMTSENADISSDVTKSGSLARKNSNNQLTSVAIGSYAQDYANLDQQINSEGSAYLYNKSIATSVAASASVSKSLGSQDRTVANSLARIIDSPFDLITRMSAANAFNSLNSVAQQEISNGLNNGNSYDSQADQIINHDLKNDESIANVDYNAISNLLSSEMNNSSSNSTNNNGSASNNDSQAFKFASEARANESRTASLAASIAQTESNAINIASAAKTKASIAESQAASTADSTRKSMSALTSSMNASSANASSSVSAEVKNALDNFQNKNYSSYVNEEKNMMAAMEKATASVVASISHASSRLNIEVSGNNNSVNINNGTINNITNNIASNQSIITNKGNALLSNSASASANASAISSASNDANQHYQSAVQLLGVTMNMKASASNANAEASVSSASSEFETASMNVNSSKTKASSVISSVKQKASTAAKENAAVVSAATPSMQSNVRTDIESEYNDEHNEYNDINNGINVYNDIQSAYADTTENKPSKWNIQSLAQQNNNLEANEHHDSQDYASTSNAINELNGLLSQSTGSYGAKN